MANTKGTPRARRSMIFWNSPDASRALSPVLRATKSNNFVAVSWCLSANNRRTVWHDTRVGADVEHLRDRSSTDKPWRCSSAIRSNLTFKSGLFSSLRSSSDKPGGGPP